MTAITDQITVPGEVPTLQPDGVCAPLPVAHEPAGPFGDPAAVADIYEGGLVYDAPESAQCMRTPVLEVAEAPTPQPFMSVLASDELRDLIGRDTVTNIDLSNNSNIKILGLSASEARSVGKGYVFNVNDHCFMAFDFVDAAGRPMLFVQRYKGQGQGAPAIAIVWSENSARFPFSNGGLFEVKMNTNLAGKQNVVAMYYPPGLAQAIDGGMTVLPVPAGNALVTVGSEQTIVGMGDQIPIPEAGYSETTVSYNGQKWVLHGSDGSVFVWDDMHGGAISPDHGQPSIRYYGSVASTQDHPFYVASDGKVYFSPDNVMRLLLEEIDAHSQAQVSTPQVTPAVESAVAHPVAAAAGMSWSHVGMSAAGGVAGGLIGLGIVEGYEEMTGEEMGATGEFAAYTASGVGTGLVTSAIAGQAVTAGTLLPSFVTGAAAGVPIYAGVAVSEEMMGVDSTSVEGQAGAIVVGSGLAAVTPFATVGGTSAAAAGFTATGVGLSALGGVAVGGAAVAGVGIGIGLDHVAGAVINSDGDGTLSGWMAEDEWNAATVAGTVMAGPVAGLAIYGLGQLVHHFQDSD